MSKQSHLNAATNRFGLNKKKRVGDLNEAITIASPFSEKDWEDFYFRNIHSHGDLETLGRELFSRVTDTILPEVQSISESDCISYIRDLVITKTYEGRKARYEIFHSILLTETGKDFKFLPDEADKNPEDWRPKSFQIDYYCEGNGAVPFIGIKACPHSMLLSGDLFVVKARDEIAQTHQEWEDKGFGRLFVLYFNATRSGTTIANPEALEEIRQL